MIDIKYQQAWPLHSYLTVGGTDLFTTPQCEWPGPGSTGVVRHARTQGGTPMRMQGWTLDFDWEYTKVGQLEAAVEQASSAAGISHTAWLADASLGWLSPAPPARHQLDQLELDAALLTQYNQQWYQHMHAFLQHWVSQPVNQSHALLYIDLYRYQTGVTARHSTEGLADLFERYIQAWHTCCPDITLTRSEMEQHIGCHFLSAPQVFYRLLNFYTMSGHIANE